MVQNIITESVLTRKRICFSQSTPVNFGKNVACEKGPAKGS